MMVLWSKQRLNRLWKGKWNIEGGNSLVYEWVNGYVDIIYKILIYGGKRETLSGMTEVNGESPGWLGKARLVASWQVHHTVWSCSGGKLK